MSEPNETRTVTLSRVYEAPIELVYEAWTNPEHVARWMKCDPAATMDVTGWRPEVGATWTYRMAKEGTGAFEAITTGEVLEADPPHVFAYRTDPDPRLGAPSLTVRVVLSEVEGGTRLDLTHSGLPNDAFCGIVEGGWGVSLELLRDLVVALSGAWASARMAAPRREKGEASS